MLCITRKIGQSFEFRDNTGRKLATVKLIDRDRTSGNQAVLGIEAADDVVVLREELVKAAEYRDVWSGPMPKFAKK